MDTSEDKTLKTEAERSLKDLTADRTVEFIDDEIYADISSAIYFEYLDDRDATEVTFAYREENADSFGRRKGYIYIAIEEGRYPDMASVLLASFLPDLLETDFDLDNMTRRLKEEGINVGV